MCKSTGLSAAWVILRSRLLPVMVGWDCVVAEGAVDGVEPGRG